MKLNTQAILHTFCAALKDPRRAPARRDRVFDSCSSANAMRPLRGPYQGFFRRSVWIDFVIVRNGPVGMAALASGETQMHSGSATGAVLGSAAEGMDLVFVAGIINKLIGNIMASPKIKTPADLKGKTIAVTSASGGSWMFTTLALEYWGRTRSVTAHVRIWRRVGAQPGAGQRHRRGDSFGLYVFRAAH